MEITLQRIDDGFNMEARDEDGHSVQMDAGPAHGGKGNGVRPMQMLIMGLGGCTAIDVVMILKKQKQDIRDFRIRIQAERETGKEPALWQSAHLIFELSGSIDPDKARRAAELSMQKYCSVAATLKAAGADLTWEVKVENP
ncbi:OsmC family protein [Compostibacter hankyongensis]|uniref:OsmC family protein n=1 Tax=Compostibacter hankyongensis TaxID=1007089 RepID=A0ABP8G6L1_9BACT